ncbi:MAG: aldose 1-epimerase family protein [Planctomycetia bacterium]|nr:aldose 1-epimerase family protein [Planctomycetia bacterium]
MSPYSRTLLDVDRDLCLETACVTQADVPSMPGRFSVYKRRLRGGRREGVDLVELDNGACTVLIVPTRGMGVWRARCGPLDLGWQSPVKGPVHPQFVNLFEPAGLGWLAGFDELLCRCGLESNGPPVYDDEGRLQHPLHGKIANSPAHRVDVSADPASGEIAVTGVVDESRLFFSKLRLTSTVKTKLNQPGFSVIDEVANTSDQPAELELLYHFNVGKPLLDEGSQVKVPVKTLVPRTPRAAEGIAEWDTHGPPQPGFAEQVYYFELLADKDGQTEVLLRNAHGHEGVSLRFSVRQLPRFILWKSTQAVADGYVTGLEPAINFPNPRPFEQQQGRVMKLGPGEKAQFQMDITLLTSAESVAQAEQAISRLQGSVQPKVHPRPVADWTPDA